MIIKLILLIETLRGQTVFLDSRDKSLNMFQNVNGFHSQNFREFRAQIPVYSVGTLVLMRTPQQANIVRSSGFRKWKRIPQMQVHSSHLCGFCLQFVDSTYSCGFHDSLSLLNSYTIICSWIPLTVPHFAIFIADSTNFVAHSVKLPVFGAIFEIQCFSYLSVESKTAKNII